MTWRTCVRCNRDLYPHLCRRTDEGWVHSRCPMVKAVDTKVCVRCGLAQRFRLCTDCKHVAKALGESEVWAA